PASDKHERLEQARLGEGPSERPGDYDTLPPLRVLGQLDETYVVAASEDGLVLVDQHAADERINYERLQAAFEAETSTQALAEPVSVEVTPGEAERLAAHRETLARLGVRAARTGDQTVEVRALPETLSETAGPELVRDLLAALADGPEAAERTVEAAAEELLADLACYPSITGNTSLTEGSIVELLERLDACENPWACPHGRPVLIEIDDAEIEARFERDYPGHSG
ncbi:DNA mismatch repair protein MutL, partial [Halobacteriales archaeon QH_10_67_13]